MALGLSSAVRVGSHARRLSLAVLLAGWSLSLAWVLQDPDTKLLQSSSIFAALANRLLAGAPLIELRAPAVPMLYAGFGALGLSTWGAAACKAVLLLPAWWLSFRALGSRALSFQALSFRALSFQAQRPRVPSFRALSFAPGSAPKPRWAGVLAGAWLLSFPAWARHANALAYEEGWGIALVAAAVTCLVHPAAVKRRSWPLVPLCWLLPLVKSAWLTVAVALALMRWRRPGPRLARAAPGLAVAVACALLLALNWSSHHRLSVGTPVDWCNVYKGNRIEALENYPWRTLDILKQPDLAPLAPLGSSAWERSDECRSQALDFIVSKPAAAAILLGRKLYQALWSISRVESGGSVTPLWRWLRQLSTIYYAVFRAIFWTTVGLCAWALVYGGRLPRLRRDGGDFLLLVVSFLAPFLVGFCYLRHISVLVLPTLLYAVRFRGLARLLCGQLRARYVTATQ